jgi:hypothetical protein
MLYNVIKTVGERTTMADPVALPAV